MGIIIFTLCLITVFFVLEFSKARNRVQEIKDTPTTDIRYLDTGRLELKADISSESETIISPLSQIECVWFCFTIKEQVKRRKGSKWIIRKRIKKFKKCILDDGTGKCEIDLSQMEFELGPNYKGKSGTLDDPTEEERNALQSFGLDTQTLFFGLNRTFRYEEYILREGDHLYVLGNCGPHENPNYEVLVQGTSESPIFVSDKSEADLISKYERKVWLFGSLIFLFMSFAVYILLFHMF